MLYQEAEEVHQIGRLLIEEHHKHLMGVPIRYVFHDQAKEKKGRIILGTASKVTGLNALFARQMLKQNEMIAPQEAEFFVIDIAKDAWDKLEPEQRLALVDHELSHCVIDENERLVTIGHDVEEFGHIVKRHGLWKGDLREFYRQIKNGPQLALTEAGE